MLLDESRRQQRQDARIDLHPSEVHEFDAGSLIRLVQALGEQTRHEERHLRVLEEHALEIRPLENRTSGRLERNHTRTARPAGEQRHLSEHLAGTEFVQREFQAGVLVATPHGNQAGKHHERSVTRATLADDDALRSVVAPGHLRFGWVI